MSEQTGWEARASDVIKEALRDPIATRLLERSNLTQAQFETLLVDQLGEEMANRSLSREEMAKLRQTRVEISRGAFNRTLKQARTNVSEAVHTILLLGYVAVLESPSLAPFLDASERLRSQTSELRRLAMDNPVAYAEVVSRLLDDLERAFDALYGRERDT